MESGPPRRTKRDCWDRQPKWRDGMLGNKKNAGASSPEKELKRNRKASNVQETGCNLAHKGSPDEKMPPSSRHSEGTSTVQRLSKSKVQRPPPPSQIFVDNSRKAGVKPPPPPPPYCQFAGILTGQRPQQNHLPCMKTILPTKPQPMMRPPAVRKGREPTGRRQGDQRWM